MYTPMRQAQSSSDGDQQPRRSSGTRNVLPRVSSITVPSPRRRPRGSSRAADWLNLCALTLSGYFQRAAAQDLQSGLQVLRSCRPSRANSGVISVPAGKRVQVADVDDGVFNAELGVAEAALGQAAEERRLAAFVADEAADAGARVAPLWPLPRGLAVAASRAAPDALAVLVLQREFS